MRKKPKMPMWLISLIFSLVLFYYETVFRFSTVPVYFQIGTWYMLLFCVAYGGFGYLLSTMFRQKKINRIITAVYIGITAIPYLVQYFVYRQFKVYYDLNTMFGGAGDALSDYSHEIFRMLFTFSGILTVVLFLLPTVLYLIFSKRYLSPRKSNWVKRVTAVVLMLAIFGLSVLGINAHATLGPIWGNQYNFQAAVGNFGLLTGIGLDVRENLFGSTDEGFDLDVTIPTLPPLPSIPSTDPGNTNPSDPSGSDPTEPTEPAPPVVYTPNQMDIDFGSLSAPNDKIKELNAYIAAQSPSMKNPYTGLFKGKNLILITAEAFTAEVVDPELTPTLYRLATKGIQFTDYYQPDSTGTTGGEYQVIFGLLPNSGGVCFKNTADKLNYFTLGSQLDRLGYYGKAYHNHSYKYYDRHKTHNNLGYSDGFMGYGNGMEEFVEYTWPESDVDMFKGTLPTYIDKQPFNIYYMTVSGHSNYNYGGNAMTQKHWDKVQHLDCSEQVKGYIAANLELEEAMTYLVNELEAKGIADDTVICLSADHFPYGLDDEGYLGNLPYLSELYGYNVENYLQRDHSRLILWCGSLEDSDPIVVSSPTFSLDILPTLSNLFGTEYDSRLFLGRDVFSGTPGLVYNLHYDWKTDYGTYIAATNTFTPTYPELELPEGYVETVKTIVRNRIRFSKLFAETDYYAYLFPNAR